MKYIQQSDFEYIINKYHDTSKPFDSFVRFVDDIFEIALPDIFHK